MFKRSMKKIILGMMLAVISMGAFAQTRQGDQSVGVSVGYGFEIESATIGLDYRYNLTNATRLAPSFTYVTENMGISGILFDLNAHYVFELSDMFGFYPIGGFSLGFWDGKYDNVTRFGLNIGLGGELYATKQISVGVEAKYNVIKDYDQAFVGIRVGYNF